MAETKTILTDETGVDIKDAITEGFKSVVNAVGKAALDDIPWSEIKADCWAGKHRGKYAIGQCKHIVVNGEICTAQIIGFDHDDLTDAFKEANPDYNHGLGKAAITWFLYNCLATSYPMNDTSTNEGGWAECAMRTETLADIYENGLDENDGLKETIVTVVKKTSAGNMESDIVETEDNLFLLSQAEVFGTTYRMSTDTDPYSFSGEGYPYELFIGNVWESEHDYKGFSSHIGSAYTYMANYYYQMQGWKCRGDDGTADYGRSYIWWLRSPYSGSATSFCVVYNGYCYYNGASGTYGLAFGFGT